MNDAVMSGVENSARERPALVSIVITVHNGSKYLTEAIASAIEQTYRPIEVIVVDDGSEDNSVAIANAFKDVRIHLQANSGASAARNAGVRLANGQMVAFLDQDDLWAPDKLQKQVAMLENAENPSLIFGHVQQFISPELPSQERARLRFAEQAIPGHGAGTLLVRRDVFYQVGEFDIAWTTADFLSWYLRALEKGLEVHTVNDIVMRRRIHSTNHSRLKPDMRIQYVRAIKESLDRKRKGQC